MVGTGWADWELEDVMVCCRCAEDKRETDCDRRSNWLKFIKAIFFFFNLLREP